MRPSSSTSCSTHSRLAEEAGRNVSLEEATTSYVDTVLREATDEKAVVSELSARPRR